MSDKTEDESDLDKIHEALRNDGGIDDNVIHDVEESYKALVMIRSVATLAGWAANPAAPRNYISITLEGFKTPFDRAHLEIVREGAADAHELRLRAERRFDDLMFIVNRLKIDTVDENAWRAIQKIVDAHNAEKHRGR